MYRVDSFIVMTQREYEASDVHIGDDLEITLDDHILFDFKKMTPVIVKGSGCIGTGEILSVTLNKSGTTTITFTLHKMSETSRNAAYIMYNNKNATGDDAEAIPGVYRHQTESRPSKYDKGTSSSSSIPKFLR